MVTELLNEKTPDPPAIYRQAAPGQATSGWMQPGLAMRKCACGGASGISDDCVECGEKRLSAQRKVSHPGDEVELEADRMAEHAMAPTTRRSATAGLIVEDDARDVGPGQMRKRQFLDELQSSVCAGADAELAAVGRSTQGCPYIEKWIGHYRTKSSNYIERSLHKFAPEAAGIASARDYIPIVATRIRRSVSVWATTGKITGVPEELAGEIPGGGLLGAVGGLLSGIGSAIGGLLSGIGSAVSSIAGSISGAISSAASVHFKSREGGAREADPDHIRSRLGSGQPLDTAVKSRMESAFGHDFSRVRIHTDANAERLSHDLNARAFTVGHHIAFGRAEYDPLSLPGSALIAHELAHVVQQGDTAAAGKAQKQSAHEADRQEDEADVAAANAMFAASWSRDTFGSVKTKAHPRMKSGLALQRCHHNEGAQATSCPSYDKQDCAKNTDATVPCCPESQFTDAHREAGGLLNKATAALSNENDETVKSTLDSRFGSTEANRKDVAADVKANLGQAQVYMAGLVPPVSKSPDGKGKASAPQYACATKCDPLCGESTDAYTPGTGKPPLVVLCYGSAGFMRQPDVKIRAGTLIHEAIHGITLQAGSAGMSKGSSPSGVDFAYAQQRQFPLLDPKSAIQNPDSYMLFVQQINGQTVSVGPKEADVYGADVSSCEKEQANRAIAWAETGLLAGQQGMMAWHSWIKKSIAAGSWNRNDPASNIERSVKDVGYPLEPTPGNIDETNAQKLDSIFLELRDALYGRSVKIGKAGSGNTLWDKAAGRFTLASDFFAASGPRGKADGQAGMLLERILEQQQEVIAQVQNSDVPAAQYVRNYRNLIENISDSRGLSPPPDKECK